MSDLKQLYSDLIRCEIELWDAVDRRLRADCDIPMGNFDVMQVIARTESCRVHDIARELSITVGGTSKAVDRIAALGHCVRRSNPVDGRSSIIELTPAGERLLASADAAVGSELERRLGAALSSAAIEQLSTAIAKVRAAATRADSPAETDHPDPVSRVEKATIMRAVVLDGPGPASALEIRELPVPSPQPGWVLIRVGAFGLNRSELHTRLGLAEGVTFPRVPGIEATGVVAECPGGEFPIGRQVVAMMGGMGRTFDGGYAEYTCVPASQVIAFRSELDWGTLGAVPEMLQTSYGALTVGLDAQPGHSILIRGGTSSVGMATAVLAKQRDMTVLSTTRSADKREALTALGVDHVLIDDGDVARQVRAILPEGVDTALELVGSPTLQDTLRAARIHGVVCFAGMLSNEWIVKDFYPNAYIPKGVRLTSYGGDAKDLPAHVLQEYLDSAAAGTAVIPIDHVYAFDEIVEAHIAMESGRTRGKLVVTT